MLFQKIVDLVNDQTDFTNDQAEQAVKARDAALISLQRTALEIEQIAGTPAEGEEDHPTTTLSENIVDLAREFGVSFPNLTPTQQTRIKTAVAGVVTGPDEVLVEKLFGDTLAVITTSQALRETMDELLATEPEEPVTP